jgi:Iap family predicted aminopeptidase
MTPRPSLSQRLRSTSLAAAFVAAALAGPVAAPLAAQVPDLAMTERIKEEGMRRSQALDLFHTLTDVYGSRLSGSPEHRAAAEWVRDRFAAWGLSEARLEPFEFGPGWSLEKLSIEMTSPRYMPLIGYPDAWSPGVDGVLEGRVVYLGDRSLEQIRAMSDELEGAIVFTNGQQTEFRDFDRPQPGLGEMVRTGNPPRLSANAPASMREIGPILESAGAGIRIRPTTYRDGTVGGTGSRTTSPDAVPSLTLSAEQYNMIARLSERGVPVELRIELETAYGADTNTYNVLADIPGTDPAVADEVVLVGAHLDSWHTAVGATDNGDGALAVIEAARILAALEARPRRTIRFALWSGEEQGLLGARAYIERHLQTEEERAKLQVYLNDDPGSGRSLGFYMESNDAAKELFDAWLEPLRDLDVTMNVPMPIGSTDHVPFDREGLPAFNVIKDFDSYDRRTRHTNADYPDRMTEDELIQQSVFLAHFAWQAAQMDGRIPRVER